MQFLIGHAFAEIIQLRTLPTWEVCVACGKHDLLLLLLIFCAFSGWVTGVQVRVQVKGSGVCSRDLFWMESSTALLQK